MVDQDYIQSLEARLPQAKVECDRNFVVNFNTLQEFSRSLSRRRIEELPGYIPEFKEETAALHASVVDLVKIFTEFKCHDAVNGTSYAEDNADPSFMSDWNEPFQLMELTERELAHWMSETFDPVVQDILDDCRRCMMALRRALNPLCNTDLVEEGRRVYPPSRPQCVRRNVGCSTQTALNEQTTALNEQTISAPMPAPTAAPSSAPAPTAAPLPFIIDARKQDGILSLMAQYQQGKRTPKDLAMPVRAAIEAGVIRRPTYGEYQKTPLQPIIKSSFSLYTNPCNQPYEGPAFNAVVAAFSSLQ